MSNDVTMTFFWATDQRFKKNIYFIEFQERFQIENVDTDKEISFFFFLKKNRCVKGIIWEYEPFNTGPHSASLYRGLNHHGSLISQCFDNVQREHRPTLV